MDHWIQFVLVDPAVVSATCAGLMLLCLWIGFRRRRPVSDTPESGSPLIDEACLAIMGLLLAFTFAAAYGKLDSRNARIIDDANAIRTLYFRCQLLPDTYREPMQSLIFDAVRQRMSIVNSTIDLKGLESLDAKARATEAAMLSIITRVGEDKQTAESAPALIDGLYAMVATHEARLDAGLDHVPVMVVLLLIFVSSITAFLMGRSDAAAGRLRRRNVTLIVIVSAIVYVTMDLEQPLRGFIRSNQDPIIRLAERLHVKS